MNPNGLFGKHKFETRYDTYCLMLSHYTNRYIAINELNQVNIYIIPKDDQYDVECKFNNLTFKYLMLNSRKDVNRILRILLLAVPTVKIVWYNE